jgi:NitT/TauT family transport system substrate-binding protein
MFLGADAQRSAGSEASAGAERGADAEGGARAAGSSAAPANPEMVRLLLNWFPEAEHGGYFAALVHGEYAAAGLEVEIQPGGVDVPVTPRVASGQVEFGVANADQVIFARAAGAKVRALLAPLQKSPRCVMVHASRGIRGFGDLNDMTLAISPKDAFAAFLQKRFPLRNVKIVPYPGSVAPFLNDARFGQQAYNISEPFVARKAGGDPQVLMLADAGYNPYTSCLIASDELGRAKPDLVRRMTEASRRGWERYLREPEATNERIHAENPEMGLDILAFGVGEMQSMTWLEPEKREGIGAMTPERWRTLLATMEELGLVAKGSVRAEECFDGMPSGR